MPIAISIPANEFWDYSKEEYIYTSDTVLHLEHSLAAIAKWEALYKKAFLSSEQLTADELIMYIRCMTLEDEETLDANVYLALTPENLTQIQLYLEDSMTATTFKNEKKGRHGGGIITAEIIYYYMVELGIPFECENWNFNRLMALIRVCSEKQAVPKKMSKKDIFAQNAAMNARRRAQLGSRG